MEGLRMGIRSGSIDPGILVYLLRQKGLNAGQINHPLNYVSSLLGLIRQVAGKEVPVRTSPP
jgi:acetate kinase